MMMDICSNMSCLIINDVRYDDRDCIYDGEVEAMLRIKDVRNDPRAYYDNVRLKGRLDWMMVFE